MSKVENSMPQNVVKYVANGTKMVNLILFLCHICFAILFYKYEANVLFAYNCISTVLFFFACEMLRRKKTWAYIITIYAGLFGFMVLAVIYLGWDYGFQQYCIGFIASLIFTDFYMYRERKITKRTMVIVGFDVLLYIVLRLWTYQHPYIYVIDNEVLVRGFYIANSLIGFAFLIMYSCIYASTVRRLEKALLEMANVDPLTGICNRRKMQQMLKAALEEEEGQPYQTVIAMLDVDHFKKINDNYGHDAGDLILVMLANILRNKQDENENFNVSRWGGEEFLIFYKDNQKSKEEIIQEFEDLRIQIQNSVIRCGNNDLTVTVTIGLSFHEKGETINHIVKEADTNLYIGKNSGRNKVVS